MSNTVLLFGALHDDGRPESALIHRGQEAYENYMLAPYMRELLMVRGRTDYICATPGFVHLYAAILALGARSVRFEELGSTLFSTVDKFDKIAARFPQLGQVPNVRYVGIEISRLLRATADALHPWRIEHFDSWQDAPPAQELIVSRSFQSTSYAFRTTHDLFDWIERSAFGIHGVRFALAPREETIQLAGNEHTFFDPETFASLAKDRNLKVTVLKSERHNHGSYPFAISWLACSRLDAAGSDRKDAIATNAGWPLLADSGELSLSLLSKAQANNATIPWMFYELNNEPFDFRHPEMRY